MSLASPFQAALPGAAMRAAVRPSTDPAGKLRLAMLGQLQASSSMDAALLRLRLHCAGDSESLWHLRVPLMQALAAEHGEGRARWGLAQVDGVFLQLWPGAPVSRPQPLR